MNPLNDLYFVEDIIVILTNVEKGTPTPVTRTLRNMQDLMNLRQEIRDGKLLPHVGDFTLDQQLWFALAKYAKLVRDRGDGPSTMPPTTPPQILDMLA